MIAIGDIAGAMLSKIGLTKRNVSAFVGRDCGCKERQERLNEFGYRWQRGLFAAFRMPGMILQDFKAFWLVQRLLASWHFLKIAVRVLLLGRTH
jgi:hypothetical protein